MRSVDHRTIVLVLTALAALASACGNGSPGDDRDREGGPPDGLEADSPADWSGDAGSDSPAGGDAEAGADADGDGEDVTPTREEPVVGLLTHQAGLYVLAPQPGAAGGVRFAWTPDNEGSPWSTIGTMPVSRPDGSVDLFGLGWGGVARKLAGARAFEWLGPHGLDETAGLNYSGPLGGPGVFVDRIHGDVLCFWLKADDLPVDSVGRGRSGLYCSYAADDPDVDAAWPERLPDPPDEAPVDIRAEVIVFPRSSPDPRRTNLLVFFGTQVWYYRWDERLGAMEWVRDRSDVLSDALTGYDLPSDAYLHRRRDREDRVTVFLAAAAAGCVWTSDECRDGGILSRDFALDGTPIEGRDWHDFGPAVRDRDERTSVWFGFAGTSRWDETEALPDREAVFAHASFWSGGASGTATGARLLRLDPRTDPGEPWRVTELPGPGEMMQAVGMAPDPAVPSGRLLYLMTNRPSTEGPGRRSDEVLRISRDFGGTFEEPFAIFPGYHDVIGADFRGPLHIAPGFDPAAPAAGGAIRFSLVEMAGNASGTFERRIVDAPFGGPSFGLGVAAGGTQLMGSLRFRDATGARWQAPRFASKLSLQALAVGETQVFFSEWLFSRAPDSLADGGGVWSLPLADLADADMSAWVDVWDTEHNPCSPLDQSDRPVPPLAPYFLVAGGELDLFAPLATVGWSPAPGAPPYDRWPREPRGCADGLWRAHRDTPGGPWSWSLVLPAGQADGTVEKVDSLWWMHDPAGGPDQILIALPLLEGDLPRTAHREAFHVLSGPGWERRTPLDLGLEGVDERACWGTGFAQDVADPRLLIVSVGCMVAGEWTGRLRMSRDGGSSFVQLPGAAGGAYVGQLGPLVLHTYPDVGHRLFVFRQGYGMLVQSDPDDLGSLELVYEGLGGLTSTAPGASEIAVLGTMVP